MHRLKLRHRQYLVAYLFLAIPMIFFIGLRLGPMLFAFNMSLRDWNPLASEQPFVGLKNFQQIATELSKPQSVTFKAFRNTFVYMLLGVPVQLALGLGIALLLNSIDRFAGFFRSVYFIPFVTSTIAIAWVWRWLYQPQTGLLNILLSTFGLPQQTFLKNPNQALAAITATTVWQGLGFTIIIFLAGLKQIPKTFYEAAKIDGANAVAIFWRITLPLLNTTIVYLVVLQSIGFLRLFDQVLTMSDQGSGGPLNSTTTVVLRVYREAFGSLNMGYASALTVILFVVILLITVLQMRLISRNFDY
jgi:multiple sugar transport system permease protein